MIATVANHAFWLVSIWLAGVFAILCLQGFGAPAGWFALSDAVLLAWIAGALLAIPVLVFVGARALSQGGGSPKSR